MRRLLLIIFTFFLPAFAADVCASADKTPQEAYIDKYAAAAVREMYRSGVPASITLAQGLLESRYGLSELATRGNNHFGIKCHDWTGRKMYHDDDAKGECFRVYGSAEESFRDHSDFLRYRDRYKFLLDYSVTDYKSWAYGLKKAGYATDPSYPSKLIKLIEDYHLYDYDRMGPGDVTPANDAASGDSSRKEARKERRRDKKSANVREETVAVGQSAHEIRPQIPDSPSEMEGPRKVTAGKGEKFSFAMTRPVYTVNGVKFIYASAGETYGSIADKYNLFRKEILKFNDVSSDTALQAGEMVYIEAKKTRTEKGLDKYISDEGGETMRDLSQRFGLKLKSLCKMNSLPSGFVTRPGDELRLR